jgi:hypothetical protein
MFVAEPLTVFAVMISASQLDIALPWMIGAAVVCAIGWVLIAVDIGRRRESQEQRNCSKLLDAPERSAR